MEFLDTAKANTSSYLKGKAKGVMDDVFNVNQSDRPPFIPLYESFYRNILTSAQNGIPVKSYWIVTFSFPNGFPITTYRNTSKISSIGNIFLAFFGLGNKVSSKIMDAGFENLEPKPWGCADKASKAIQSFENNVRTTLMLVQGIKIPGEAMNTSRQGMGHVGGFVTPLITGNRKEFQPLEITFLENNSSIVDFAIRPWLIHSSYASLKYAKKATIDCYKLIPSSTGFRVQKKFTFYNAVPVSIDDQTFKYKDDDYGKRQTQFAFTDYIVSDGESLEEDLKDKIKNWGYKTLEKLVYRGIDTASDFVFGGADRIMTNVVGEFKDEITHRIEKLQRKIFEYGNEFEDYVTSKGTDSVHVILPDTRIDNDTVKNKHSGEYKHVEAKSKTLTPNQNTSLRGEIKVVPPGSSAIHRDTPSLSREGVESAPIQPVNKIVTKDDIVNRFVELSKFIKVELEGDDNVDGIEDIILNELSILEDDVANIKNIGQHKEIPANDNIRS